MLQVPPQTYYELKVFFPDQENGRRLKSQVLAFISALNLDFVDEIVDGIDTPVNTMEADELTRCLPIGIYFSEPTAAAELWLQLQQNWPSLTSAITEIDGSGWSAAWRDEIQKILTEKFVVYPQGLQGPATDKTAIYLKKGTAFGDGQHATTEACLRALEQLKLAHKESCLDVGTGTGILLIAVGKMGMTSLHGTEIAAELVDEARTNINANGLAASIALSENLDAYDNCSFDLVIANILVPVLVDLLPAMERVLRPGGLLLLSGFIGKEVKTVVHSLPESMTPCDSVDVRGWKALTFTKRPF